VRQQRRRVHLRRLKHSKEKEKKEGKKGGESGQGCVSSFFFLFVFFFSGIPRVFIITINS
jgi:hypothetical protein